jgi:hypothetical protein
VIFSLVLRISVSPFVSAIVLKTAKAFSLEIAPRMFAKEIGSI